MNLAVREGAQITCPARVIGDCDSCAESSSSSSSSSPSGLAMMASIVLMMVGKRPWRSRVCGGDQGVRRGRIRV